jgi:hypothetical protein
LKPSSRQYSFESAPGETMQKHFPILNVYGQRGIVVGMGGANCLPTLAFALDTIKSLENFLNVHRLLSR